MPDLDNLILNITSRISHQTDFAFGTKKGELANQLQSLGSLGEREATVGELYNISLDEDGDIIAQIDRSTIFLTEDSVNLVGWVTTPRELTDGNNISMISSILI